MMKANLTLIAALMLLLPALGMAQVTKERDVVAAAGEYASSANLSLSWTAGETAVTTATTASLIVTQGFQQADQTLAGIEEAVFAGEIKVFPNPVQDVLNFEVTSDRSMQMEAELYELSGRKVREVPAFRVQNSYRGSIDCSDLPAGEWLLRFRDTNGKTQKSFTVIKLN